MWPLFRETFSDFSRHGGRVLSGSIAFYALLSFVPMVLIALSIAGSLVNEEVARGALVHDLSRWVGEDGGRTVATLLQRPPVGFSIASIPSVALAVYASTRLFGALVYAIHQMWGVRAKSGGGLRGIAKKQLRKRALSFAMVFLVGVVLVALVVAKTTLAAVMKHLHVSDGVQVVEILTSFAITAGLFAALFRVLPDVVIATRDLLVGALVTAVLFSLGANLIAVYLGRKAIGSTFGAAGSVVLLLLWVHYSAQIFFLGVSFTGVWARKQGRPIAPNEHTLRVISEDEAGLPLPSPRP
ncbi:MAG: YihY/virulence factor BrkB family protein [Polyangiales bacterium]